MAGTVTVASKLASPLVLQLQAPYKRQENVMGVIKDVTYHRFQGQKVVLNGASFRYDQGPRVPMAGGFALTHGVPKDLWEKWVQQNEDNEALVKGFLFAFDKPEDAAAQAKEMAEERSGFEPINPTKLPAEFQRKGAKIETMERS